MINLEFSSQTPPLVVGQRVSILLEDGVDAGNAAVPGVLQIFKGQSAVLRVGLLSLKGIRTVTVSDEKIARHGRNSKVANENVKRRFFQNPNEPLHH